jgi:hypothetical protein
MIVSFSGSQSGMTKFQKEELPKILKIKQCTEFAHGDCIGADLEGAMIALECGITVFTIFPPDNYKKRAFFADEKRAMMHNRIFTPYVDRELNGKMIKVRWMPVEPYLVRNTKLVDYGGALVAAPKEYRFTVRSGTWATIRYAWQKKKDEIIIPPVERTE